MASFKSYLNNNAPYLNAFNKLNAVGAKLNRAKAAWQSASEKDKNYAEILAAYNAAKTEYASAEREKNLAQSNAKVAYDKIQSDKQVEEQKKKDAEIQKQIDATQAQINKYTNAGETVPTNLQSDLDKAKTELTGAPQGPKTTTTTVPKTTGTNASSSTVDDSLILDNLFKPGNEQLLIDVQKNLKKFGYNGPADGVYSEDFKNAFNTALQLRGNAPTTLKGNSLLEFIANPKGIRLGSLGSGTGGTTTQAFIADDTQAASLVKDAFKTNLQREATADEVIKYSKILQAAQRKNPFKTTNGVRTGGINENEFLAQQLQKLPEYATKKAEKLDTTKESVLKLMRANGLPANKDQVDSWATAIQNGTTLDTVSKQIRQIAGAGLPDNVKNLLDQGVDLDTIYSPYKSTMASTLELNPNDIQLNDPTLRLALGPDKEMSIYDFQKILKKDNRWQYTTNAKEEISNSVQKVLQDFGFQG